MEKEDKILLATIEDKIEKSAKNYTVLTSGFLDLRQRGLVTALCKGSPEVILLNEPPGEESDNIDSSGNGRVRAFFYGGYEDAERCVLVLLPDYSDFSEQPIALLKVRTKGGMSRKLSHRDYLGSLLGLGIKREKVGDIIVLDEGADIIILKELSEYLAVNYEKAGRANLNVEIADISELDTGKINIEEKRDTVASLRLDSIKSSAFGISRGKAQEAIKAGLVFVNSGAALKPDMQIDEGDKLVLRGRGKAVLREITGKSRKDRICVVFDKYV